MAATTKSHRYLGGSDLLNPAAFSDQFDFDESEVWNINGVINLHENNKPVSNPRSGRKPLRKSVDHGPVVGPRSLPVNIPDWSKILRGEYRERAGDCGEEEFENEEEDKNGNDKLPPHEYLAKTRVASFSVHEGVGRTLKGRDLSRVRNAIWKQTGFED
ncbi:hypothetical protein ACJIZ3_024245 [Penstemon smallii]|uniref:Senescence regulator S40 n=1 Tax=Penstemon smallii TaxID=265156 RepID=A0ABD3TRA9_9LAMI